MKITILGSGGGEGFPATFCGCAHCEAARRAGGKSIRTLSQTLINDDLLIDLPADTAMHVLNAGLNLGDVANILITHTHSDHFIPQLLNQRGACYAHELKHDTVGLYGSSDVKRVFDTVFTVYGIDAGIRSSIKLGELSAYEQRSVGNYTVTALSAKHAKGLTALNYVISDGEKTLLYLLDTGYPTEETFAKIKEIVPHADAVIMDATMGVGAVGGYFGHMGFEEDKLLKARLTEMGVADLSTVFVANHITHNQAETHDVIEKVFDGSGILVAYDGMTLEI